MYLRLTMLNKSQQYKIGQVKNGTNRPHPYRDEQAFEHFDQELDYERCLTTLFTFICSLLVELVCTRLKTTRVVCRKTEAGWQDNQPPTVIHKLIKNTKTMRPKQNKNNPATKAKIIAEGVKQSEKQLARRVRRDETINAARSKQRVFKNRPSNNVGLYVRSLANPEQYSNVSVPDGFDSPTYRVHQTIDFNVDDTNAVTVGGQSTLNILFRPSLTQAIAVTNAADSSKIFDYLLSDLSYIWFPRGSGSDFPAELTTRDEHINQVFSSGQVKTACLNTRIVHNDGIYNVPTFAVPSLENGLPAPSLFIDNVTGFAFGLPSNQSGSIFQWLVTAGQLTTPYTTDCNVGWTCFDTEGNNLGFTAPIASSSAGSVGSTTQYSGFQTFDAWTYPSGTVYIQPYFGSSTNDCNILAVNMTAAVMGAGFVSDTVVSQFYDCKNAASIMQSIDNYRVVSASMLVTYVGNVLQNSELAARTNIEGPRPYDGRQNVMSYGYIASCVESYTGPLNKGAYVVWRPTNIDQATQWYAPHNDLGYDRPWSSVVMAWPTGQGCKVRVRCVINFECQTNSSQYTLIHSNARPGELEQAMKQIVHFKLEHCNLAHISDITDWLSKAAKGVWNNRNNLADAISPVLPPTAQAWMPAIKSLMTALPDV